MAIKLYQWDVSQKEELTHPTTFSGDYVIRWFQSGYVSMTTEFATLFNTMNNDLGQPNSNLIAHYSQPAQPKQKAQQAIIDYCRINTEISEAECSQSNVIDFGPGVGIFDDNKAE